MLLKLICSGILGLMITEPSGPNMRKLVELSKKHDWVFLTYERFQNKTLLVSRGKNDLIYPKTDVAKTLGLNWDSDLEHHANPSLSPDGNYVAYVRRRSGAKHDEAITIHNVRENTSQDLITSTKGIYGLHWSPTGKEIAFVAEPEPFVVRLYTVDVSTHQVSEPDPGHMIWSMSWSPDGKEIVVAEARGSSSEGKSAGGVFVVNRSTKSRRKIGEGGPPSWAPNGKFIAYLDSDRESCYLTRPDGTNTQKLFSYKQSTIASLSSWYTLIGPLMWSPDTRYLLYHKEDGEIGDRRKIYLFDLKTKKKEEVFSGWPLEIVSWR